MNLLNIDVKNSMPSIIDAYTKVYGNEYRELIEKRLNKIFYIMYNDVDGMESYVDFLKSCKQKELTFKFLEEIGMDVSKYKPKSYAEKLNRKIRCLIGEYIGFYWGMSPEVKQIPSGIKAWDFDDEDKGVKNNKIRFINFLRGEHRSVITGENFQDFCQTDEYKQILEKIEEYLQIYHQIAKEYEDYLQEIEPYQRYVVEESRRRDEMQTNRRNLLYEQIEEHLSDDIKAFLDEKYSSTDEKSKALFGNELGVKTYLEFFSQKDENKLKDASISEDEEERIYNYRVNYFQQIGVTLDKKWYEFGYYKELYEYYIQQEDVKKLILPTKLVDEVTRTKNERI